MKARVLLLVAACVVVLVGTAVAVTPPVVSALRLARSARAHLSSAESSARRGIGAVAVEEAARARDDALAARAELASGAPAVVGAIPLLGRPLRSARELAAAAAEAATGAGDLLDVARTPSVSEDGVVDIAALERIGGSARRLEARFASALERARGAPGWPLPPQLARARGDLIERLDRGRRALRRASAALAVAPSLVGASEKRRYLLVAQNPTELRATGGFWGSYAIVEAGGGRLSLVRPPGRPERYLDGRTANVSAPEWYLRRYGRFGVPTQWRNLGMTPDFPTAASVAERSFEPVFGPLDGTIALDPPALAGLLRVTGPVVVGSWPEPIGAGNIVRVTLHHAYVRLQSDERRVAFLGELLESAWSRLLSSPGDPRFWEALGDGIRKRRIQLHSGRPDEQRALSALGAAGALRSPGSTTGLVTQNAAPSKMDFWLRRKQSHTVRLRADGSADMDVRVTLLNEGSADGPPAMIDSQRRLPLGANRQYVSLYMPRGARLVGAEPPGEPVGELERELGFLVVSRVIDVPAGSERRLRYRFVVLGHWKPETGRYRLTFRRQPALHPDALNVRVIPPPGWRLAHAPWPGTRTLDADTRIDVRLSKGLLRTITDLGAGVD